MATSRDVAEGFYQGKALRQQQLAEREKRVQRAVANVLDGSCSITAAAEGQGVPVNTVAKRVRAAREALKGGGA